MTEPADRPSSSLTAELVALRHENAALRRALATQTTTARRHELALEGLTRALHDLRRGALALRAENAELRAGRQGDSARRPRGGEADPSGEGLTVLDRTPG